MDVKMYSKAQYHHNPILKVSIALLLEVNTDDNIVQEEILKDINLYHQPLQIPWIAATFFIIRLVLLFAAEYLQFKVYNLMKKEKGLVKNVTQLFVVTQMIFWPFWLLFASSTDFFHPMNELVGQWYCDIGSFLFWFLAYIIAFHSFITALMRYFFIVHQEKVEKYGKERIRKIFFALSVCLPFIVAIWNDLDGNELDAMSFINKCNGRHHKVFLIDTSTLNVMKRNFCTFENDDSSGRLTQFWASFLKVSCFTNKLVQLMIGFNITEGILYYKILSYKNREHKESMKTLKRLLSDSSKNRRGRRNILCIQITFFGWLVEVIAFLTFAVGAYIFGHGNSIITLSLQTLTMTFYSIFLPCTILINGNDVKAYIVETNWYFFLLDFFGCQAWTYPNNDDAPVIEEVEEQYEQIRIQNNVQKQHPRVLRKVAWNE